MSVSFLFPPEDLDLASVKRESLEPFRLKRNTKAIGDISEAMVIAELVSRGFLVSIPFGENHRYDLIADDGKRLLRIQVKTGRLRGDVIAFSCSSSHYHRRQAPGESTRPYFGQIEYLAVFCPGNGKVYLLPDSELVATRGHLRINPARNRQERNVRWASEYELA
jgi:hypothetical protein